MMDALGHEDATARAAAVVRPMARRTGGADPENGMRLHGAYLADSARVDQRLRGSGFRRIAQILSDHQYDASPLGSLDHAPASVEGARHGALGKHVLAGFRGRNRLGGVLVVDAADVHGIDVPMP